MPGAYYNEIDPYAAQWLRNLIAAGHIAPGDVDERSIEDIRPSDLRGYTQCHFFAGIGVWSSALRLAGWSDERSVWTGSCPCQPFSAAGKGAGFADERHLWPAFHYLIEECRPSVVLGEQVASADANPWIDLVQTDLEALGFAFGAVAFPSAGVGAPHIRDRAYWLAYSSIERQQGQHALLRPQTRGWDARDILETAGRGEAGELADAASSGSLPGTLAGVHRGEEGARARHGESERPGAVSGLADAELQQRPNRQPRGCDVYATAGWQQSATAVAGLCDDMRPGPTNGFWQTADWIACRDEKWRPVERDTQPLAYGLPTGMGRLSTEQRRLASLAGLDGASLTRAKAYRVGTLRAYGNAINREAAAAFIAAADEAITLSA